MTRKVPGDRIEAVVGHKRHARAHYGRAVSSEQTFYILHSVICVEDTPDLRDCPFSLALDRGIDQNVWEAYQDTAVLVQIGMDGRLWPGPIVGGQKHNHITRDIKPYGVCPACDSYINAYVHKEDQ